MWLEDEKQEFPEWMKPEESNVILTWRVKDDIEYVELLEAGETVRSDVLSWAIQYALNNELNINYQINGGWNKIGNPKFLETEI